MQTQVQPPETTEGEAAGEQADRGSFMGTKNFVPDGGDWFAKTKDASDRIGNDPLNPMKSSTTLKRANGMCVCGKCQLHICAYIDKHTWCEYIQI